MTRRRRRRKRWNMKHRRQTSEAGRLAGTASKGKGRDRNKRCYVETERMVRVIHLRLLAATLVYLTASC
jgi:hypothetical protein